MRRAAAALACLAFVAGAALAQPARVAADAKTAQESKPARVALVIGNAAYKEAPLANTLNDARDVAKNLEAAGFKVLLREDATLKQMQLAIREFGDLLGRKSSGVFYFAGHGVQVRGRNYLVPVDADIAREDEVAFSALDLAAVLEKMDTARNPLNLVILDACRNNPFATKFQLAATGLAQIDAPAGTLIAFSTAPGSVASDGSGRNGLYTQHLLREMVKPGAAVEEVFKGVRAAVRKESGGKQVPWESTSLEAGFTFVEAPRPPPVMVAAASPSPKATAAGKGAPRAVPVSIGAPPALAKGDSWRYRLKNLLSGDERAINIRVTDIRGEEVLYQGGGTTDLVGNAVRSLSGDRETIFRPSSQVYVFPLRTGGQWNLTCLQEMESRRFDNKVTLSVVGEEEIETPAGRFKAVKVVRSVAWKERGKDNAGTHLMTYWYNSAVKRMVAMEATNTTSKGKVFLHERQELERYEVQ
jgi:hypothetical protein